MAAAMAPAVMEAMAIDAAVAGAAEGGAVAGAAEGAAVGGASSGAMKGAASGVSPSQFAEQIAGSGAPAAKSIGAHAVNAVGNAVTGLAGAIGGALIPGSSGSIKDPGDTSL